MNLLVMIGAGLVCAACSKSSDAPVASKAPPSGGGLSVTMASANPTGMTPQHNDSPTGLERYERIVRNVEDCPLEGYQVVPTCPGMQMFSSGIADTSPEIKARIGRQMITSASPAVRITAAELMNVPNGISTESLDTIATAASEERDSGVLRAFLRVIADHGMKNRRVGVILVGATRHADKDVRLQGIYALSLPANRGVPDATTRLAALATEDPEPKVRQAACEYSGRLGSDDLLPMYEKLTASSADHEMYASCMEGLVAMFHNHPSFDTANEGAYKLFLRRLDAKPRTEHSPPWNVMSTFCYFSHESDLDKLAAWKKQATWFKPADVKRAMSDVVADKTASWMARAAAVESMVGLGASKSELEALKRGYSPADRNDKPVLDKIASAIAE